MADRVERVAAAMHGAYLFDRDSLPWGQAREGPWKDYVRTMARAACDEMDRITGEDA